MQKMYTLCVLVHLHFMQQIFAEIGKDECSQ